MDVLDVPWCTCGTQSKATGGFIRLYDDIWGHFACKKPTKMFWENQVLINMYKKELDEIIERIIEKRENEDGLDKGRAETACLFIAMILNPTKPNLINVRNEAVNRYMLRKK